MAKTNKYREAHPEWFDEKGRPTPEVLRALIDYNPETGEMRWKERGPEWFTEPKEIRRGVRNAVTQMKEWNRRHQGKNIVTIAHNKGIKYACVSFFGSLRTCLSIAYAMQNLKYADGNVFAADGDMTNLRIDNIVTATSVYSRRMRENLFFKKGGSSSYRGVSKHLSTWRKRKHLGVFKTEEDAADAYDRAVLKYLGPTAYLNIAVRPGPEPEPKPEPKAKPRKVVKAKTTRDDF